MKKKTPTFPTILEAALPIIVKELELTSLPEIKFKKRLANDDQPTFGRYYNGDHVIYLGIDNRHPLDIIRTLAHEMVHYKQDIEDRLDDESGNTGSPIENEANAVAGVIMRHLNKKHPEFFSARPIVLSTKKAR